MLSELHQSHQSFILIILFVIVVHYIFIIAINFRKLQYVICQGTCCYSTYPYQQNCHGFKGMIPRVTQLPVLSKLPHKTRPHATNEPRKTSLTVFFRLCQQDEFARIQLYADLPAFYTWNRVQKVWKRRNIGRSVPQYRDIYQVPAIGRVYTVNPK